MRFCRLFAAILAAVAFAAPDARACPFCEFDRSPLVVRDRNGPPLEVGDLLDWVLTVKNTGCITANVEVTFPLVAELELESAGQGGVYDPATRTLRWDSATTPALGAVAAYGSEVPLDLATRVLYLGPEAQLCGQGSILALTNCAWPPNPVRTDDPVTSLWSDSTCLPAPAPIVIARVDPCHGVYDRSVYVTVEGSGFRSGVAVEIGSQPATVLSVSPSRIDAVVPRGGVGPMDVFVFDSHERGTLVAGFVRTGTAREAMLVKQPAGVHVIWGTVSNQMIERSTRPDFACRETNRYFLWERSEAWIPAGLGARVYYFRVN